MTVLWPHQQRALSRLAAYIERGGESVVAAAPTGAGKTAVMRRLIQDYPAKRHTLYVNRRMLFDQLCGTLDGDGIPFGMIASHRQVRVDLDARVQVCMAQTVSSRLDSDPMFALPPSDLVHVDEAHNETGERMRAILGGHAQQGATIFGWTATPCGLGELYRHLEVFATNTELRACGPPPAHLPADTYAPSEIDAQHVRKVKVGPKGDLEYINQAYRQQVFGQVVDHWRRLSPEAPPTILFAPGVAESRWFAEQFAIAGYRAAHVDGERVAFAQQVNGQVRIHEGDSRSDNREWLKRRVADGGVQVVCNRFVLREGVDIPELQHLIFATPFDSLVAYLQAGGRVLRYHPSHDRVIVQDHGGNWWRHGSLNSDREWSLEKTGKDMERERADRIRRKSPDEPEPITCPECGKCRLSGPKCPTCGHSPSRKSRNVLQVNGRLKPVYGDIYRPRTIDNRPQGEKDWTRCYWRCRNARKPMTFTQAEALYAREHGGVYPDPAWEYMPLSPADRTRRIKDVTEVRRRSREGAAA